jgi:hypothetical protein
LTFRTSRRLNFGDCDPSGIAYFPSYLHILVGVLEEFFQELGAGWPGMIAERRIGVPTVRLDLTFKKPGFTGTRLISKSLSRVSAPRPWTLSTLSPVTARYYGPPFTGSLQHRLNRTKPVLGQTTSRQR